MVIFPPGVEMLTWPERLSTRTLRESRHSPNVMAMPPRIHSPTNTPTTIRITFSALAPCGAAAGCAAGGGVGALPAAVAAGPLDALAGGATPVAAVPGI